MRQQAYYFKCKRYVQLINELVMNYLIEKIFNYLYCIRRLVSLKNNKFKQYYYNTK